MKPLSPVREDFAKTAALAADFLATRGRGAVSSRSPATALDARLAAYAFDKSRSASDVASDMFDLLGTYGVRSDHPRYFGLFNPPAAPAAILGDLIAATVNPQLAVWSHAPAAAEIERKLLTLFGTLIGWEAASVAGMFTSGGSEANYTALMAALARRYPDWSQTGLRGLSSNPTIYVSSESHLAWIKIARNAGLGSEAVRLVPAADGLSLRGETLAEFLEQEHGRDPVLIVATVGTTAHGAIDDVRGLAEVARRCNTHLHADAAWAGGALLSAPLRSSFVGIDAADSVTIDPHKWLSVPMGAGMYLARDWRPLESAFAVQTGYMPSASMERRDAYIHSWQWSRRFIGLKLFMALATLGIEGYSDMIQQQMRMGRRLRSGLLAHGWRVLNDTPLPLVCFAPECEPDAQDALVRGVEAAIVNSGNAWISSVSLRGRLALRACVTSYETTEQDIDVLLDLLDRARAQQPIEPGTSES